MNITSLTRSGLRTAAVLLALPILLNCQQSASTATTGAKSAQEASASANGDVATPTDAGPCADYATRVCAALSDDSPECATMKAATELMPEAACTAGLKDIAYTTAKYKESRKVCDELVNKLCNDLGKETETCGMVTLHTKKFPADRCASMMEQYPQVIADLKKREEANKPLSAEKQAALSKDAAVRFGSKEAKVTIIEFSDFECPYCSRAADTVSQIKEKYKGNNDVQFIFRQFPLGFHKNAQVAAEASLAANEQGKFWEFHDMMFENQKQLHREALEGYAKKLGLNMEKFTKALDDKTYEGAVKEDLKLGELAAVSGTPSMFINGARVTNPTDFTTIQKLIDAELTK